MYIYICTYICMYTHTHTYNGILLDNKKNEILLFTTAWMDLEGIILIEISRTKNDNSHPISFTGGMWDVKKNTKKQLQTQ